MCGDCRASRIDDAPFTDCRDDADWRTTEEFTPAEWLAHVVQGHPFAASHYFYQGFVRIDTMHTMDSNGITNIICGSVISHIVSTVVALGSSKEQRLEALNGEIDKFWETHLSSGNPIRKLHMGNNHYGGATSWACLHGPAVKAANCRQMSPFF